METIKTFGDLATMVMSAPVPSLETTPGGWSAVRDIMKVRVRLCERTMVQWDDATRVLRWASNGRVVPVYVLERDARLPVWEEQRTAYERETTAALEAYRDNQGPASAEERSEMRAAFGKGTLVVDVLTGRRTQQ